MSRPTSVVTTTAPSALLTKSGVVKNASDLSSVSCTSPRPVITSNSAKVMPVFYIQSSSTTPVRVATANGVPTINSSSSLQKLASPARLVPGPRPSKPATQHLVIQQAGGKQYAYVGTIIKPHGNKELLLTASSSVLPKLAPAPPPTTVTLPTPAASGKMASLLVTLPSAAAPKPGTINLKIANGQIHNEGKGCITVLRDSTKMVSPLPAAGKSNGQMLSDTTSTMLTLTPVSSELQTQSPVITPVAANQSVLIPVSVTEQQLQPNNQQLQQREQLEPKELTLLTQPQLQKEQSWINESKQLSHSKELNVTKEQPMSKKLLLSKEWPQANEQKELGEQIHLKDQFQSEEQSSEQSVANQIPQFHDQLLPLLKDQVQPKEQPDTKHLSLPKQQQHSKDQNQTKPQILEMSQQDQSQSKLLPESVASVTSAATIPSTAIKLTDSIAATPCTTSLGTDIARNDTGVNSQDLNRCLQEVVESFSPTLPPPQTDDVMLIKVVKQDSPDTSPRTVTSPPEDDVKIELVKQDIPPKLEKVQVSTSEIDGENFDPMKVLEWKDGVGTLPGSDLKFRMNEFGMMEIVDEDDCKKLKGGCKSDTKAKAESLKNEEKKALLNGKRSDFCLKLEDGKKEKTVVPQQVTRPPKKNKLLMNVQNVEGANSGRDEIFCCEGCGCYGLSCEFVSSRFCSESCASNFASRRAQQSKRERDLLLLRLRRRKKRLLQLMQLQQAQHQARHRLRQAARERQLRQCADRLGVSSKETALSNLKIEVDAEESVQQDITIEAEKSIAEKESLSWLTSKKDFSWTKYLDHCKAKPAPVKLFRDPLPYTKNGFKVGMKLEGIDPQHPSYFCVLTVAEVQGYRIRLHFDGYPENHDFWVNADSVDIFPAGWCEKNNHKLHPPLGYSHNSFSWSTYLKQCHAQAAPRNLFVNKSGSGVCPSSFRVGMKLEAVDRHNSNMVCVATVSDVVDNRILVHFDGWDDVYDYWADPASPYIHPVGWCEEQGRQILPPSTYCCPEQFSWDKYLQETKSSPAPARAFKRRTAPGFQAGMGLECVDPRVPQLIRVATVSAVRGHRLRVEFDGWPREYGFWLDDDSPDLHPVGWSQKTGHPLEPPIVPEEFSGTSECPVIGCHGVGHIHGPKFATHSSAEFCPYAPNNFRRKDHIPDRLSGQVDKEDLSGVNHADKRKTQSVDCNLDNPPAKLRRTGSTEDIKPTIHELDEHIENRRRMSEEPNTEIMAAESSKLSSDGCASPTRDNISRLENEVQQTVREPGYDPQPSLLRPISWEQGAHYLNSLLETVQRPLNSVGDWTCSDVANFVRLIPGCAAAADAFERQEVDGEALLLVSQEDLVRAIGLKLGPAIKLYNCILLLRHAQS